MATHERSDPRALEGELSRVLAAALAELRPSFATTPIRAVAIDFHPWDPVLEISILTVAEWSADPLLLDEREQAAWSGFHATDPKHGGSGLSAHPVTRALHDRYRSHAGDRAARASLFALAHAALSSDVVQRELARWSTHAELALYASDPDEA